MGRSLRALIVEDVEQDALLVLRELKRCGYDVDSERVETREAMLDALQRRSWDVILSDYALPRFSGPEALRVLQETQLDLPFIIISGTVNEEIAVESIHAGAHDFMAKGKLARLGPAIEREMRDAALRSERARLERAMEETRGQLEAVLTFAPVLIMVIGGDDRIRFLNRAPAPYSKEDVIGSLWTQYVPMEDHARQGELLRLVRETGEPQRYESRSVLSDGTSQWFAGLIGPIRHGNDIVGVVLSAQDITDLKRSQEQLRVSDRMAAVGALAAGVSHDFNNILAVILSFATFARDALPEGDQRRADIEEVMGAANRAVGLTRQLLAFARQQPKARKPTNVSERLQQIQGMLNRTVGGHIKLVTTYGECAPVVLIDPIELDQIVLNLVVNARDAMPNGGKLAISLECETKNVKGAPVDVARLTVTDTGSGMDEATRRRIFEPFFTTKEPGKGTGLGLATCFSIVEEAGGEIAVESEVGRGTTFEITLPLCAPLMQPRSQRPSARPGHGEYVLVVEDETALRRAMVRILQSAGYVTHAASNGSEAVALIDRLGVSLDVVVTDIMMPGTSGYDVADYVARAAPDARVILTSGYMGESTLREAHSRFPLLWKPVTETELLRAVGQAIALRREQLQIAPEAPEVVIPPAAATGVELHSLSAVGPADVSRERVLVVDDDPSLVVATMRTLRDTGLEVVSASTVAEARRRLAEETFHAMVVDVGLPDGSGLDLLPALRGASADVRVVVVTGRPTVDSAATALRHHVHEYLTKPYAPDALVWAVRGAIEANRMSRLQAKLLAGRIGDSELMSDLANTERLFASALQRVRMVYQPIVRSRDGSVFGYEALLRSDEPSLASPARLLTAAEILGRVTDLGRVVRASVAATMLAHSDHVDHMFVNLHPSELHADILGADDEPLIPLAQRIVLEVTERASLDGAGTLTRDLSHLRSLGFRIAVDDLGEGYAGLTSLVTLRPEIAKIDMSLVRDVQRAPLKRDIIAAIVDLARRSRIQVVAEGIETVEERDTLIALGCDLLQGYLFAKPGPPFPVPTI